MVGAVGGWRELDAEPPTRPDRRGESVCAYVRQVGETWREGLGVGGKKRNNMVKPSLGL